MTAPDTQQCRPVPVLVADLRLGMFVTDLKTPWMHHSFLRSQFLIKDMAILGKLRALGASHQVMVDPSQCEAGFAPETPAAPQGTIAPGATPPVAAEPTGKPAAGAVKRTTLEEELRGVHRLVHEAKRAILAAMQDGRTGKIKNLTQVQDVAEQMVASTLRNASALHSLTLLKSADDYTFTHCVAVGTFMISLGRTLGLSEDELVSAGTAGLLHDVGKAGVSEKVLNKPGKLTDEEYAHIRLHPVVGETLLVDSGFTNRAILDVVRHHHERPDGRGYPDGLQGDALSLLARMGAVTDVYDAVTSRRCYHSAMTPTAALHLLLKNSGTQFDARVVSAFVKTLGLYPIGSLVRLKSEKLAVVKDQAAGNVNHPLVRVIYSTRTNMPVVPYDLNLTQVNDAIISHEMPKTWNITQERIIEVLGLTP